MITYWTLFTLLSLLLLGYMCNGDSANAFYCGFEMGDQEFQSQFETTDRACVALDDQVAYRGKKSLRLTNPDGGHHGAAVKIPIDATSGPVILEVSGAVKVCQVQPGPLLWMSARFYVHTFDQAGNPIAFRDIGRYHHGTTDWIKVRRMITLPKGTKMLRLNWSLNDCRGTAWFDEIKVVDKTSLLREPESTNATVTVEPKQILGKMRLGIGWNWETVSPQRFSDEEAGTWDELFRKMDYDGTDWIRMGVNPAFYVPAGYEQGKDTGQKWTYQVDNRYTRQIVRLLEHCEKRGIPVLLCNWGAGGGYQDVPNDHWLATGFYDPARRELPDWLLPYSDNRFVEGLCSLVKYLKVDKGFSCIKYVSIWNEPDGNWMYQRLYPRFFRIYELLDAELKRLGLRDKVKILGPESIEGGTSATKMARDVISMGGVIDVAAVHDYGCGTPAPTELTSQYKNQEEADGFAKAIKLLRAFKKDMPIAATELGGIDLTPFHDARTHFLSTLGIADYLIRCITVSYTHL
ncbi:MAG: hypothetical protein N3B12_03715, partial [Armatimonadetes bacterium]|nr:hypothetical protein [Armatimonadota bacterium]